MKRLTAAVFIICAWIISITASGVASTAAHADSCGIAVGQSCYSSLQDAINYSDAVHGGVTITLAAGAFDGGVTISNSISGLTIVGQGEGNTLIAGDGGTGAGTVIHAVCCQVVLSNLTVTGGTNSGIINDVQNQGDSYPQSGLTLNNVSVDGNTTPTTGGGIWNRGADDGARLTLNQSLVSDNAAGEAGGGIYSEGSNTPVFGYVTMEKSTVSDNCAGYSVDTNGSCSNPSNSAGQGGGIAVLIGDLQIHDGAISGNTASGDGGGIWNEPGSDGGYYWNEILTNMTIANNSSGGMGGGLDDVGVSLYDTVILDNDTIAENYAHQGGGLAVPAPNPPGPMGPTELISTVLADNHVDSTGSGVDCYGIPQDYLEAISYFDQPSASRNIIGNISGCDFEEGSATPADIVGAAAQPVDVELGMLGSNGGLVDTMALGPGSPAIGEGDPTQCGLGPGSLVGDHDARFQPRNTLERGKVCDAGAYDTGGSTVTVPGEPSVSATAGNQSASVSWSAPTNNGGQKIYKYEIECTPDCGVRDVDANTFSTTVTGLTNYQPYQLLVSAITNDGIGAIGTSNAITPVATWYVNADSGQDPSSGCDGNSEATPYKTIAYALANCVSNQDIVHLEAATNSYDGNLTINKNITIQGDSPSTSSISGGTAVISVPSGVNVTLHDVTITGGEQGIENQGNLTVTDSRITGNGSSTKAGALENAGGTATIDSSTIDNNTGTWAGAIWSTNAETSLNVVNSTITDNHLSAVGAASAIYLDGGSAHLTGDTITANHGDPYGLPALEQGYNVTSFVLTNTILDGNLGPGYPSGTSTGWDCSTAEYGYTGSYDLIGGTCAGFGNQAQNSANHIITNVDAHLGVLAANGGPTDTMALGPDSPAIGAGEPSVCADPNGMNGLDQRGQSRNSGGRGACDIGAFDTSGGATVPVAPQNVAATAGVLSAIVGWTAPNDGQSPITGYAVTCTPDCPSATGLNAAPADTSATVSGLAAGQQYTFTVYATSSVGAGEPATSSSITIKSPKPNAPTVTLDAASDTGSSNGDGLTNDDTPTFKGTADPNVPVSVFSDGGLSAICTGQADSSGNWSCAPSSTLADGTHTITATANNGSGTSDPSAALTITIDTQPPSVAIDAGSEPATDSNVSSEAFTFTAQDDTDSVSSYTCSLDGTSAPCAGTTAAPVYTGLADGSHTFTVQATDLAGNTGSATYTWLVDTQPPTTVATGSLTDTGASYAFAPSTGIGPWTNDAAGVTVTLSAGDSNGSIPVSGLQAIHYSIAGAQTTTDTPVSGNSATVQVTAEGISTVTYYAVDNAGNAETAHTVTVEIDGTAPSLNPSVSPNPVLLNGHASAAAGAMDSGSGIAAQSCVTPVTSKVGSLSASCTATDVAGNTATKSASYAVTYGVRTVLSTSMFGPLAVALQLEDATGANVSSRGTRLTPLCVVAHTLPAATSCGLNKALKGSFTYLPLWGGVYVYMVETKGLVVGQQYDLLFEAAGDPIVHADTFTETRPGRLGRFSVGKTRTSHPRSHAAPRLRIGIWAVPHTISRRKDA